LFPTQHRTTPLVCFSLSPVKSKPRGQRRGREEEEEEEEERKTKEKKKKERERARLLLALRPASHLTAVDPSKGSTGMAMASACRPLPPPPVHSEPKRVGDSVFLLQQRVFLPCMRCYSH
jgi:hypothetical protein